MRHDWPLGANWLTMSIVLNPKINPTMETDFIDYNELVNDANRALGKERERITAEAEQVNALQRAMDAAGELISKNEKLTRELEMQKAEVDMLHARLQEEKEQRLKLEMQLNEMSKLTGSVAGKASHDELLKALRTFVNKSKQKRIEKRTLVKEMVLELVIANGIVLPPELAATIESLDDEQPAVTQVVNVAGNYNDIHDNEVVKGMNIKE